MAESRCEMKKEIGSIFPLSNEAISMAEQSFCSLSEDRLYYSLCRESMYDIAKSLSYTNRCVLIPAYTCQTVITPFVEAGWKCKYYAIHNNLRVDVDHLFKLVKENQPSLIVTHPYFGMDLNEEEISAFHALHHSGIRIVLDLTQCIFSEGNTRFADYVVASYRKWFPISDGGFLMQKVHVPKIQQPQEENIKFTELELSAMYLRGQYFANGEQRTKDISIKLSKTADHVAESNIVPHRISQIAYNMLNKQDITYNIKSRYSNYSYLFKKVKEGKMIKKVCQNIDDVTTAPLYFPIYVKDRLSLQHKLAQDAIYAPVIWPVEDDGVLINDEIQYIYDHLLAIPCDQRYEEQDMQRVVEIINNY